MISKILNVIKTNIPKNLLKFFVTPQYLRIKFKLFNLVTTLGPAHLSPQAHPQNISP